MDTAPDPASNGHARTKPVIDAVNDTVGALSELVRSLRARARAAGHDVRTGARRAKRNAAAARRTVASNAKAAVHEAAAIPDDVKGRLKRAWADLTGRPPERRARPRRRP